MKKFVRIIIPVCAVVVLIISCINLGSIFLEYNRGVQEYKELQEYVNNERPQLPAQEKEEDDFLMPEIDFAGLKAKNEDFRYWLYIPALEVNYPVVQGKDVYKRQIYNQVIELFPNTEKARRAKDYLKELES